MKIFLKLVFDDDNFNKYLSKFFHRCSINFHQIPEKFQRNWCFRSAEKRRHVLKRYMRDYRGAFYSFHENAFSIKQLGDNLFLYGDLNEETRGRNSAEPPLLPCVSFCTDSFAFISIWPITLFSPFHAVEFPAGFKS